MTKRTTLPLLLLALAVVCLLAVNRQPERYYPELEISAPLSGPATGTMTLQFLFNARSSESSCEAFTGTVARKALAKCPGCAIKAVHCHPQLDENQQALLSTDSLDVPSGRLPSGVVAFLADDPEMALAACREAQRITAGGQHPLSCHEPDEARPLPALKPVIKWASAATLLALIVSAVIGAWLVGWLIIRYEKLHAHLSHDHVGSGPQKYHAQPTPRIGGVALLVGLLAGSGTMLLAEGLPYEREISLLLIAGLPAFLGGLVEDVTKKVGVLERLLLTMISGAVAAWLLGATLTRLDMTGIDRLLLWLPFAVIFTSIAVGGVANAMNIIDGYNGLASGFSIIALLAIAWVANLVGDALVVHAAIVLAGALAGFFVWNWPRGRIFLGDGGAYLLGFLLAELSVLLVVRNPSVSPWFPLLVLVYPIFETFFSMYRRRVRNRLSPGQPDNRHLHQLIHDQWLTDSPGADACLRRNSRVGKYFWGPAAIVAAISVVYWDTTEVLTGAALIYCVMYVALYEFIARRQTNASSVPVNRP